VLIGSISTLEAVWNFSDVANGLMAIPNLIALFVLSKVVKDETDRYFREKKL
jgi:AGCS family alanine or glycine:cation symporter